MSGLGIIPWSDIEWLEWETLVYNLGWVVVHCAHCDRSNNHPSCYYEPIPGVEQKPIPYHEPKY